MRRERTYTINTKLKWRAYQNKLITFFFGPFFILIYYLECTDFKSKWYINALVYEINHVKLKINCFYHVYREIKENAINKELQENVLVDIFFE